MVRNLLTMQETPEIWVQFLSQEAPLEEGMATHFSILAWRIPCTGEPGRLQSLGHNESDTTEATEHSPVVRTLHFHWRRPESNPWLEN